MYLGRDRPVAHVVVRHAHVDALVRAADVGQDETLALLLLVAAGEVLSVLKERWKLS